MADLGLAILSALASGGVLQYPDKQLYKAAMLLTPEERPNTAPVRVVKPLGMVASGTWDGRQIHVNKRATEYGDPRLLAAVLAHEAEHERRDGQPGEKAEEPAYQKQFAVLDRLGYDNKGYRAKLMKQLRKAAEDDTKRR